MFHLRVVKRKARLKKHQLGHEIIQPGMIEIYVIEITGDRSATKLERDVVRFQNFSQYFIALHVCFY